MYGHRTIANFHHQVFSALIQGGNKHGENSRLFRHPEVQYQKII